ncbi:hypothetical protein JCM10003_3891 [Bacteroides pyogenes JCM 10003]|nr:hypothetical protein JCM10003_3891 [Bacteroides pyogenes JCM 10003]
MLQSGETNVTIALHFVGSSVPLCEKLHRFVGSCAFMWQALCRCVGSCAIV